jgi:uncharacterized Zn ribbon protein
MMYLDEDMLAWAQATGEGEEDENKIIHRDSNGVVLLWGLSCTNQRPESKDLVSLQNKDCRT